jgi:hypothetical protein
VHRHRLLEGDDELEEVSPLDCEAEDVIAAAGK